MRIQLLSLLAACVLTSMWIGCTGSASQGVDFIDTDNYANRKLEFYYYIPQHVREVKGKSYPLLICVPALSGRGEAFVSREIKDFADKEGFAVISPSFKFDDKNWQSETSYQFPHAWSGNALLDIVNKVEKKEAISLSRFHLFGFSAGAQFALRFALWNPEIVAACAAHGSGGTIVPQQHVPVRFFVSIGKDDKERIPKVEMFCAQAKAYAIEVSYKQYEGGHVLPKEQIEDSLKFFSEVNRR